MLQGERLTLTYQDGESTLDAVHDVSIEIEDHQFFGILGPLIVSPLSVDREHNRCQQLFNSPNVVR